MVIYADLVAILNFAVDFFLLLGTNRLSGYPPGAGKAAMAAGIGAVYAGLCLIPGFGFLRDTLWRLVSLAAMAMIAFGVRRSALRRGVLFVLLSMALGGAAYVMGIGGFWGIVVSSLCLCLLCIAGFRDQVGAARYVPVELSYGGATIRIIALRDTGNTLSDPVTGQSVLVIGAEVAQKLTGLTHQQLRNPVESIQCIPGLRLIPYRTVGQPGGMLLGLKLQNVKVGHNTGSCLVAFAPETLSGDGEYQALTGGVL